MEELLRPVSTWLQHSLSSAIVPTRGRTGFRHGRLALLEPVLA